MNEHTKYFVRPLSRVFRHASAGFTQHQVHGNFQRDKKGGIGAGFTLLEQLVSISILGGLALIVGTIFISANNFTNDEQQRIQVGETAARVLDTLDDTLREGRSVLVSGVVNSVTYTTSDSVLVLALPSIIGGQPTADDDIVVVIRDPVTNTLQQLTEPDTTSARAAGTIQLATGVNDVYFRYTTNDPNLSTAVTALISSTRTANKRDFTRTILLYETLRNHP